MKIFVKTVAGRTITLDVESTDTIEDVVNKIQENEGIPSYQNCLILDGKRLQNSHTLANCGIKNESKLHLEWLRSGGSQYEWWWTARRNGRALALKFHLDKKICCKCYARVPAKATNCRKKKCGHSNQLREKKGYRNWRRILS
ncbi:ubiquitin-ribosomal protein eL40 fusion protein-like [Silene latifolia]|uniref:ubiquitin-ribosomal protein eL40 fusion protein-like n=1 Tax=Silene latifolia TaxID=37657 RepID=UPI003D76C266